MRSKPAPAVAAAVLDRGRGGPPANTQARPPVQRPPQSAGAVANGAAVAGGPLLPPMRGRAAGALAPVAEAPEKLEEVISPADSAYSTKTAPAGLIAFDGVRQSSMTSSATSATSAASSPEPETRDIRRVGIKSPSPTLSPRQPAASRSITWPRPDSEAKGPRRATVLFFDPQQLLQNIKGSLGGNSAEQGCSKVEDDWEQPQEDKKGTVGSPAYSQQASDSKASQNGPLQRHAAVASGVSRGSSRRSSDQRNVEFIHVAIRIRPMLARNKNEKETLIVDRAENQITVDLSGSSKQNDPQQAKRTFKYDYVFDSRETLVGEIATQDIIFEVFGDRVVRSALGGYNACLFAYGQTGTGKTHTVMGHPGRREERGLLPRILESLFAEVEDRRSRAQQSGKAPGPWQVRISYLEVFNEQLHDLLVPPKSNAPRDALQVRYHPTFGVVINDLTEAIATNLTEALELLNFGTRMRSIAATSLNSRSSRAHTVFTFRFEQTSSDTGDSQIAQVQLIDLAGREQEKSSSDNRERLRERQFINTSLFHLSTCILNLSRGAKGKNPQHEFAFRNSRLTLLLAHSLSGNSRTHMIGAVSPAASDTDETLSTLRFADAVKKIRTTVSCNRVNKTNVVKELTEEIKRLKQEMKQRQKIESSELQEQVQQLETVCAHYAQRLEQEQNNSKALAAEREACLKDLGLSVGAEGVSLQVAADQGVPYLVNLSDDPYLAGCLMYFLKGPEEVTLGSAEGNTIRLKGLGIKARHCAIKNEGNQKLFLRIIDAPEGERDKDQPRAFLNGSRISAIGCEMMHSDRLVLGHSCAFRVVVPLSALSHQHQRGRFASGTEKADLEQALAEIEDSGSRTFQHLRKYVEDLENNVGAATAGDFVREVHRCVPLVDEANQITREIRQAELTFSLQVLTDLWSSLTNMPELVVTVLSNSRAGSPRASTQSRSSFGMDNIPAQTQAEKAAVRGHGGHAREGSHGGQSGTDTGLWQNHEEGFGPLKFVWSFEKFKGRLQSMRDIYEEMQRHGLAYVQRRLDAEPYIDPWKEIGAGEVQVLIDGVKNGEGEFMSADFLRRASALSGSSTNTMERRASASTERRASLGQDGVKLGSLGRRLSRELQAAQGFDGAWTDEDRPGQAVTFIKGEELHWNDGEVAKMTLVGKDSFMVSSNGDVYTAHLQPDGRLKWDFGGIWIRDTTQRISAGQISATDAGMERQTSGESSVRSVGFVSPLQTPLQSTRGSSPSLVTRSGRSPRHGDSDGFDNGAEGGDLEGLEGAMKVSQWYNIGRRASRAGSKSLAAAQDQLFSYKRGSQDLGAFGRRPKKGSSPRSPGMESRSLQSLSDASSCSDSSDAGSGSKSSKRERRRRRQLGPRRGSSAQAPATDVHRGRRRSTTEGTPVAPFVMAPSEPAMSSAAAVPSKPARSPPLAVYATGARPLPQVLHGQIASYALASSAAGASAVVAAGAAVNGRIQQHDGSTGIALLGTTSAGLPDSKELPQDLADLRRENRRLQTQLQELVMRDATAGVRSLSDAVSAAHEAERAALDNREQKLRAWAERLERKENTLLEMEKIAMQLRRLQKCDWEAKSEAVRLANGARPPAGNYEASSLATQVTPQEKAEGA